MKLSNAIEIKGSDGGSRQRGDWGGTYGSSMQTRRRKGLQYFTENFGAGGVAGGFYGDDYRRPDRILSSAQMWEVYRRCSDVRAAIDSVVRRVATFDWLVEPKISPQDPMYEELKKKSLEVQAFLQRPNRSGQTWQEIMTAFLTDLLCFDAGALELVYDRKRKLTELVPLRSSTIIPIVNAHGMVQEYQQQITSEGDYFGTVPDANGAPTFKPDQIMYMSLYTNTANPQGNPLLECLVHEVIALMRATEHAMLAMDADEIPQGILVLAGIAGRAAEEAKADLQRLKGQDHKIRIMTTPDPSGIGAKWLELRRSPKDIEMREIIEDIRKTIYRVFGVMPVEMGMSEGVNRATAQVQMDVSSSHLVTPMIELLQAKINGQILPTLLGAEMAELIHFRFDREARLNSTEQKAIAEVHQIYVRNGIMTRNEAREVLGLRPLDGGDIATVDINVGTVPLRAFESSTGIADVQSVVSAGAGESILEATGEELLEAEADAEKELSIKKNVQYRRISFELPLGAKSDSARDDWFAAAKELPSEWQNPAGINTIDLRDVGNTISTYIDSIVKVWRASRSRLVKSMEGSSGSERFTIINNEVTALFDDWQKTSDTLYGYAADIGAKKALSFSSYRYDPFDLVAAYKMEQYGYLNEKLLGDLRSRLMKSSLVVESKTRSADVDEDMEAAYNNEEYRIAMYAGALLALAYLSANTGITESGSDPMTLWIAVGDKHGCSTCSAEDGTSKFLSERNVLPASGTQCFTRCRCILSYS